MSDRRVVNAIAELMSKFVTHLFHFGGRQEAFKDQ